MVAFPSNVLVIADYDKYHFKERIRHQIDFVLSCGDIPHHLFEEIYRTMIGRTAAVSIFRVQVVTLS